MILKLNHFETSKLTKQIEFQRWTEYKESGIGDEKGIAKSGIQCPFVQVEQIDGDQ